MSCSDKLARWHAIGMQGAMLSLLLSEPLRLASLTVAPPCSVAALSRAILTRVDADGPPRPLRLAVGAAQFSDGPPVSLTM